MAFSDERRDDQDTVPEVSEEDMQNFGKAIRNGILLSIPLWALIIGALSWLF